MCPPQGHSGGPCHLKSATSQYEHKPGASLGARMLGAPAHTSLHRRPFPANRTGNTSTKTGPTAYGRDYSHQIDHLGRLESCYLLIWQQCTPIGHDRTMPCTRVAWASYRHASNYEMVGKGGAAPVAKYLAFKVSTSSSRAQRGSARSPRNTSPINRKSARFFFHKH